VSGMCAVSAVSRLTANMVLKYQCFFALRYLRYLFWALLRSPAKFLMDGISGKRKLPPAMYMENKYRKYRKVKNENKNNELSAVSRYLKTYRTDTAHTAARV
jgi:hypothetical protein